MPGARNGHPLDEFGEMRQKADDVVLGDFLDLVDARDVEFDFSRLGPDRLCRRFWDDADLGQSVAGVGLNLEPDPDPRLRAPDGDHFGAGVAGIMGECSKNGEAEA